MRKLLAMLVLLAGTAAAQMFPGPGTPHSTGGGGGSSNLGYTTIGATNAGGFVGYAFGNRFTTGTNGGLGYAVNTCSAYYTTKDGVVPNWQCGIYTDSAGAPGSKVCASSSIAIGTVPGWSTSTTELTGCGTLADSTSYWIFLEMQGNGTNMNYDGATGAKYKSVGGYGTWNASFGAPDGDWGSTSLYITVTAN